MDLHAVARTKKVVMINFWATWCAPCRVEMPQFAKIYKEYKDKGLEILAVNEDRAPDKLDAYLTKKPVAFPILLDPGGKVAESYGIRAFPTTIMVDKSGKVLSIIEGTESYIEWQVKHFIEEADKSDRTRTGS